MDAAVKSETPASADNLNAKIEEKIKELLGVMFEIDSDRIARLDRTQNLFDQLGIDSLQAFEAIVTLHDIIEEDIPRDIDPTSIATLEKLATYLATAYPPEKMDIFFAKDVKQLLAERAADADEI